MLADLHIRLYCGHEGSIVPQGRDTDSMGCRLPRVLAMY